MLQRWRHRAWRLKSDVHALYLASRDPRVPWAARILAICVVAYVFSPLDLVPDPIPVFGYLDDLLLVPLGIALVIRLIPGDVLAEHRQTAQATPRLVARKRWIAAAGIVVLWAATFVAVAWLVLRYA